MQAASSQPTKGSTTSGQEGPAAACQLTNRKARSAKQLDLQSQSLAGSSMPHRGFGPEDAEYANLIGAMDNDLDRPESLSGETVPEQSSQSIQNKGTHIFPPDESRRAEGLCDHRQVFDVRVNLVCSVGI